MLVFSALGFIWGLLPDLSGAPVQPNWGGGYHKPAGPALPIWFKVRFFKIFFFIVNVIGSIIGVLVTRMMLELMIVVFRIVEDIGTLKRKFSGEEGKV